MRKSAIACCLLACLALSCTKEKELDGDGKTITLSASCDCKTTGTTEISFESGDCLTVFDSGLANNRFSQVSGSLSEFNGTVSSEPTYAVYPYSSGASVTNDGIVKMTLPSHYEAKAANSVLSGMGLSIGKISQSGGKYTTELKNVCGLVGVNIPSDCSMVTNVRLTAMDGQALTGTVSFSYNGGTPEVAAVTGSSSVDFDISQVDGGSYYFAVLPGMYEGIQLVVTMSGGKTRTFSSDNTLRVERNGRILLKSLTLAELEGDSDSNDLSAAGCANCYIVRAAGTYKFKCTTKGGSSASIGTPAAANVLWESSGTSETISAGDIIKSVSLEGEYVSFTTSDTFRTGNAVIAVTDASDNILWSWHIWCPGIDVESQAFGNSAGSMMNCNLGAIDNQAGSESSNGLYYQWGRKDPFPATSTVTFPAPVGSQGDAAYAAAHPTTFILQNTTNYDWYNLASNTRWVKTKNSQFDPCPYGWKVPYGGADTFWSVAKGGRQPKLYIMGTSFNSGYDLKSDYSLTSSCWLPAAGFIDGADGMLKFVGNGGFYWAAADDESDECGFMFTEARNAAPILFGRADGNSVRCISVK